MLLPIQLAQDSAEPLYHQIKVQLRALILSGRLEENTPLPSIRELALDLSCSVITIRRVYQDLEGEGLIRTRQGTGTFVAKVGSSDRERHRKDMASAKMKEALEVARSCEFTNGEIRQLLEELLQEETHQDQGPSWGDEE